MSTVLIFILIIVGFIIFSFLRDSINESDKITNEGGIYNKYKTLINNFVEPESGMKVIQKSDKYICVGMQNTSGYIIFHFQHTFSKINVTFEMKNIFLGHHKLDWDFPETMPQSDMIRHIETRTRQYMDNVTYNNTSYESEYSIEPIMPQKGKSDPAARPTRIFDKLALDNFLGLIIKETTKEEVMNVLISKGISFREFPDLFHDNKKTITFSYNTGDIDWNCHLDIKDDVLYSVVLYKYSADSYSIYQTLCREMTERYNHIYNISTYQNKQEGTETITFAEKGNNFNYTEIEYDSSPIINQKNIYIYFRSSRT